MHTDPLFEAGLSRGLSAAVELAVVVAVGFAMSSCGPGASETANRFLVYDRDAETGKYVLSAKHIGTLHDPRAVDGRYANLQVGGSIQTSTSQGDVTAEEVRNSIRIEGARTPTTDYEVQSDGVAVPWDFHTAMMFTLYHHLGTAHEYFVARGVKDSIIGKVPVYYYARRQILIPVDLISDNAAYAFTLDAFLIPPTLVIEKVPLAANRGVIVHEFSHLIFNRLVHGDSRAPPYLVNNWPNAAQNRLAAINEGIADLFAALQTNDPNFIDASLSKKRFDIDRDLSKERHYSQDIQKRLPTDSRQFNPYELGSVIASTVWTQKRAVGRNRLAEAVLATMRDLSKVEASGFTTSRFFNLLHEHLPKKQRGPACRLFHDRLNVIRGELTCDG